MDVEKWKQRNVTNEAKAAHQVRHVTLGRLVEDLLRRDGRISAPSLRAELGLRLAAAKNSLARAMLEEPAKLVDEALAAARKTRAP